MNEFDGLELELGNGVDLAVIWLHGLGADASDFAPVADALGLPFGARFVFPNAPARPVTINAGMVMRAWYDITGFDSDAREDRAGLSASAGTVLGLIEREVARGVARERIVLAGFSQGGAVVLHAGLGRGRGIGGILGLSTYLPAPDLLGAGGGVASDVPVWLAHGTFDSVIPLALAERSARFLAASGASVEWTTYPMAHEVTPAEIADISAWLTRRASR